MKGNSTLPVFLIIAIVLNMILSFFLINPHILQDLAASVMEEPVEVSYEEPIVYENQYYQLAMPELSEVVAPYQFIAKQDGQFHEVYYLEIAEGLKDIIEDTFIQIITDEEGGRSEPMIDPVGIGKMEEEDHFQFIFLNHTSLALLEHIIRVPDSIDSSFQINRIIIPADDTEVIYLVDHYSKSYYTGRLANGVSKASLFTLVEEYEDIWSPVEEYQINRDTVYLPSSRAVSASEVFTIDELPESLFLNTVFKDEAEAFAISRSETANLTYYNTFQTSITVNDDTNMMTVANSSIQSGSSVNPNLENINQPEKVSASLNFYREYAYWNHGARLFLESNNQAIYRRFLFGRPVYSHPNLPDYGSVRITLRANDQNLELSRLQKPLLDLGVHVDDLSQEIMIESGEELEEILEEQGLQFAQFNQVFLAFEWQEEMEGFRKVTFVPKWYFVLKNQTYSIDQIKNGEVVEVMSYQPFESQNELKWSLFENMQAHLGVEYLFKRQSQS